MDRKRLDEILTWCLKVAIAIPYAALLVGVIAKVFARFELVDLMWWGFLGGACFLLVVPVALVAAETLWDRFHPRKPRRPRRPEDSGIRR